MFTIRLKTKLVILTICFTLLFNTFVIAECVMMAMIAKKGHYVSWVDSCEGNWNDPYDFFNFLQDWSPYQDDGYGVIYYPENGSFFFNKNNYYDPYNQAWYKTNQDPDEDWHINYTWYGDPNLHYQWIDDEPLIIAKSIIMNNETEASIVLGHDRDAVEDPQGNIRNGNHPHWQELNGKFYSLEHNGNISDLMQQFYEGIQIINPEWFQNHESNWEGDSLGPNAWIDSELYFHYILSNIEAVGDDVIQGIYNALSNPSVNIINEWQSANFILSDGIALYAYRRTFEFRNLEYQEFEDFWSIKTQFDAGISLSENDLAIISPYGDIEIINLENPPEFYSGTISQNKTWSSDGIITGDILVPEGITLNINANVSFVSHNTFTIHGTVNLLENSSLNLKHSTVVIIEDSGILFLDWGSTITGSTPTTYEATPPGQQPGGEDAIPGDRIIAKNGGIITTNDDIENIGAEITIGSGLPEGEECMWDGILIQNPSVDENYWFVNCDISWIRKLSIENVGFSSKNTANLMLYQTDFHNSGQIVARDGHLLYIHGSEDSMCYIQENTPIPITAYESPVDISYCWIGGVEEDDGLENGGGIYLYDSASPLSIIENTNIMYNGDDGLMIDCVAFEEFNNNSIENNTGFGMFCYSGTEFTGEDPFYNISICNNAYAEYAGWQSTFIMNDPYESIWVEDTDYGSGLDQYLLMDILWDTYNKVDISGTNLTLNDLPHLYPPDSSAWTFSEEESEEKLMLYSASTDIGNEDYTSAEQTLQQIISDYYLTEEAGIAVYYLYHLEKLTDQDFNELITYLENLTPESDTPLEKAIENVITKSYMKEKEYFTAIDRLETIITNSQIPDEVIAAMIDEGYCYLELSEEELKASPSNCTVRTSTLEKYQAMVNELKHSFSFYNEEPDHETTPASGNILSLGNFPNPFKIDTRISFTLASASDVTITIYNVKGQRVKQLMKSQIHAGSHTVTWNGMNSNNVESAPGIYFYKIRAGGDSIVKKMFLIK